MASGRRSSTAARGRRIRDGPVDGDAPPPGDGPAQGTRASSLFLARVGRHHLSGGDRSPGGRERRAARLSHADAREAGRMERLYQEDRRRDGERGRMAEGPDAGGTRLWPATTPG